MEEFESNESTQLSNQSLFDDEDCDCNMVEDDDLVGILLQ